VTDRREKHAALRTGPTADEVLLDKAEPVERPDAFRKTDPWRVLRIMGEFVEGFERLGDVKDAVTVIGSARVPATDPYYRAAIETARLLALAGFPILTGGGPGIMEAANRGASEAEGLSVGLTISIPDEEFDNPYISQDLHFYFHYFFMRKFWFVYLAKAVVLFPGGYGTLDELFEILTLVQTRKTRKRMPIVLFGTKYWDDVINFEALVKYGTISPGDLDLFHRTDSLDEAYDIITKGLTENALGSPGPAL